MTDPTFGEAPTVVMPERFVINKIVVAPAPEESDVEVVEGLYIKPFPKQRECRRSGRVALIKVGDNSTTDHIMPSNANCSIQSKFLFAEYCLTPCEP